MELNAAGVLNLIFEAKKTGRGRLGRGKIYVELMSIIADSEGSVDIGNRFGGSIDRFLLRLMRGETEYPYGLFSFEKIEQSIGRRNYYNYIALIKGLCDKALDDSKIPQLVYTLLEVLQQDETEEILYGGEFILKNKLYGSSGHPKQICFEALLLGILYHVHKYAKTGACIHLLELPDRLKFRTVRFTGDSSLKLDVPVNIESSIAVNFRRPYIFEGAESHWEREYQLEMICGGKMIKRLPDGKNIFLYGAGAKGKTTIMLREINHSNLVKLYFPLYKYRYERHEEFDSESCWLLVQILLKYFYQYEYLTFETACACEGKDEVLRRLEELKNILKRVPVNGVPEYTLLLDGLNEISSELQSEFIAETEYLCKNFNNIQIIISGRTVPAEEIFEGFRCIETIGATDKERDDVLAENPGLKPDQQLLELLKTPLFLNMYIDSGSTGARTRGELLDAYIMNYQSRLPENSLLRFAVQFVLPFAAKTMTDSFGYEIDRGDISDAIKKAAELYLMNDRVYQNYIAPRKFNKKALIESIDKTDVVELLINNASFLASSSAEPQKLHFTHQYFRDYFAAKYIINIGEALWTSFEYKLHEERRELFQRYELDLMWFYNEEEIYRLIGEISGDFRNVSGGVFCYRKTVLDKILDLSRYSMFVHTAECVIKTMELSRSGVICGVDFSGQCLPIKMPAHIKFSLDGQYPCDFSYCTVFFLEEENEIETGAAETDSRQLSFKNCDFTGAEFFDEDSMEELGRMGAIIQPQE